MSLPVPAKALELSPSDFPLKITIQGEAVCLLLTYDPSVEDDVSSVEVLTVEGDGIWDEYLFAL